MGPNPPLKHQEAQGKRVGHPGSLHRAPSFKAKSPRISLGSKGALKLSQKLKRRRPHLPSRQGHREESGREEGRKGWGGEASSFRITPPTSHFVRAPTTLPSSQARDLQRGPFRALLSDQDPPEAKTGGPEHRGLWVLTLSSFPRHSPSRGAKWPRGADACGAPWPRRRPLALPGRPGWPCATGPRTGTKVALQHASLPAKREVGAVAGLPWGSFLGSPLL